MKRRIISIMTVLLLLAPPLRAQVSEVDCGTDVRARVGATVEKKIVKGLHVYGELEGRFKDNLTAVNDIRVGAGINWKATDWLRLGAGYTFIDNLSVSDGWEPRHRIHADITGSFRTGDWRFSLRERIQMTHKAYFVNPYQEATDAFALKSRFKVSWKGSKTWEPYAYVEMRNALNDPSFTATYSTTSHVFAVPATFNGYNHAYINRYRGAVGVEWRVAKHNFIDIYGLVDRYRDKDIDTNRDGTASWAKYGGLRLKSINYDVGTNITFGVAYKITF